MSRKSLSVVSFCVTAALATSAYGQNLIANGGFEDGTGADAAAWEELQVGSGRVVDPANARTGNAYGRLNVASPAASILLQNSISGGGLPDLVAGNTLVLNFWARGVVGDTGNMNYALRYLNSGGGILFNSGAQFAVLNPTTYQQYTFVGGVVPVGAVAAFVELVGASGPTQTPLNILIDDVSVTVVPEPTVLGLIAAGSLAMLRRRRA